MIDPFHISADEINCLIYAYFKDSGFQHSAFVLRAECHLENSSLYTRHVPRGELVDLLGKALLFSEVEAHWRGDNMTMNCTNNFKLLERHVCSYDPNLPPPPLPESRTHSTNVPTTAVQTQAESSLKRKASAPPLSEDQQKGKRAKTVPEVEMSTKLVSAVEPRNSASSASLSVPSGPSLTPDANTNKGNGTDPVETGEHVHESVRLLRAHTAEVFVCAWNPVDLTTLASGSKDSVVHIWNVPLSSPNETEQPTIEPPLTCAYVTKNSEGDLTSITWSSDGKFVAVGCYDSVLRICDARGGAYFTHTQHDGPIFAVRFSPSGRWLVTASLDGSSCVWDVKEKRLHRQFKVHKDCCLDADWLTDSHFVTSGSDNAIYIMSVDSPKPLKTLLGHEGEVNQVKLNPSRTRMASCSDDHTGRIWNVEEIGTSKAPLPCVILKGHENAVSNIVWSPFTPAGSPELIATTSFDGTARIWDSTTGRCLCTFHDHKQNVYAMAFSPDGRHVATAGADGWLHVYDVQAKTKQWSWSAGVLKPSIFEIVWQQSGQFNRIAMAMERCTVGVVDLTKIPELR